MKRLFLFILVLAFSISVFAQETIIDKSEFDKMQVGNFQALRNKPHRIVEESFRESSGGVSKNKTVIEINGLARYFIFESDNPTSYMKTENIYINNKRYTRKLNQNWVVEDIVPSGKIPFSQFETTEIESVYKNLGEKSVDGKQLKVYQSMIKRVTVNKDTSSQITSLEITDYYFDESGLMIKSESSTEMISKYQDDLARGYIRKEQKSTSKMTRTIEIDPKIKIEAPQIG